jgi:hypothetical protein
MPRGRICCFRRACSHAYQRAEAIRRRAAGETLASIGKSYAVDISMISRLPGTGGTAPKRLAPALSK